MLQGHPRCPWPTPDVICKQNKENQSPFCEGGLRSKMLSLKYLFLEHASETRTESSGRDLEQCSQRWYKQVEQLQAREILKEYVCVLGGCGHEEA